MGTTNKDREIEENKDVESEKHLYLSAEGTERYVKMAEGYNGQLLIKQLKKHLAKESTVLELGMGPGVDLDLLKSHYTVTGSDYSKMFLDRYRKTNPSADLFLLDAATMKTKRRFDCIYSNKVLHHLSHEDLELSIKNQIDVLNPDGIVCHSFWKGTEDQAIEGLFFHYLTLEEVRKLFETQYDIIEVKEYEEMSPEDSIYVLARKKAVTQCKEGKVAL